MPYQDGSATPLEREVDKLGSEWFRRREVASALGVTPGAISELYYRRPEMAPTNMTMIGKTQVYLYTAEDIERLRAYFERPNRRPGRPRMWSPEESDARQRQLREARHLAKRADAALNRGESEKAADLRAASAEIRKVLDAEEKERRQQLPRRRKRMSAVERDHRRLAQIEAEYRTTVQVVAVLVERLLSRDKGAIIVVKDAEMQDPPDLIAHRDDQRGVIALRTTR